MREKREFSIAVIKNYIVPQWVLGIHFAGYIVRNAIARAHYDCAGRRINGLTKADEVFIALSISAKRPSPFQLQKVVSETLIQNNRMPVSSKASTTPCDVPFSMKW